jgi:hypothetical protein
MKAAASTANPEINETTFTLARNSNARQKTTIKYNTTGGLSDV